MCSSGAIDSRNTILMVTMSQQVQDREYYCPVSDIGFFQVNHKKHIPMRGMVYFEASPGKHIPLTKEPTHISTKFHNNLPIYMWGRWRVKRLRHSKHEFLLYNSSKFNV